VTSPSGSGFTTAYPCNQGRPNASNNNFVKNQTVNFVLTDVTGGSLSVAQAVTNSQGQAKTFYNASNATSAANGVRVDATVQGTAVTDLVQLTVAQRQVFISFGTGNQIEEPNQASTRRNGFR
jgi:hypothetical protein